MTPTSARAYEAAGFVMLANIDLLIAIWDGEDAAGVGGTAQIVSRAIADGIPVIRLDPKNPSDADIVVASRRLAAGPCLQQQPHACFRPADEATVALVIEEILACLTKHEFRCRNICRKSNAAGIFAVVSAAVVGVRRTPAAADGFPPSHPARRNQSPMARLFLNPAERPDATSGDRNHPAASVQRRRSPRRFLFARLSQLVRV